MQQGLESELMGLPMDLSSGAICADFISSHPALAHSHLMGDLQRGVKADVHSGRWGAGLTSHGWGNVPLSPLPCSCSLRRQPGVLMSLQTHHP